MRLLNFAVLGRPDEILRNWVPCSYCNLFFFFCFFILLTCALVQKDKTEKAEKGGGKKEKKKKKKDPNAPKKPQTAYFMWYGENYATLKKEGGTASEIAKRGGNMWRELSEDVKQV